MVITTQEYLKIRLPYIKTTIIFALALLFFIFSLYFGISFLRIKNFYYLIFFLIFLALFLTFNLLSNLLNSFLENIGLILFEGLLLFVFLYYAYNNIQFTFISLLIFLLLRILAWYKIYSIYKNSINFNWNALFAVNWNYWSYIISLIIFLSIFYFFSINNVSKEQIINFINYSNYFFEALNIGITPDTKIEDIVLRNVPQNLDEATKKELVNLVLEDINKKFNLKLKPNTKIKEFISDYLIEQIQKIKTSEPISLASKIIVGIFVAGITKFLLSLFSFVFVLFSFLFFILLKALKLIKFTYEKIDKELITVD